MLGIIAAACAGVAWDGQRQVPVAAFYCACRRCPAGGLTGALPCRNRIPGWRLSYGCVCRIHCNHRLVCSVCISRRYIPIFVGLSRGSHTFAIGTGSGSPHPLYVTGLNPRRAHVLTGFLMASLAHTQVDLDDADSQLATFVGEYGVDFIVMLVAACIASRFPFRLSQLQGWPGATRNKSNPSHGRSDSAAIVLFIALGYGHAGVWPKRQGN